MKSDKIKYSKFEIENNNKSLQESPAIFRLSQDEIPTPVKQSYMSASFLSAFIEKR
jgi:hypothetical protein